MTSAEKRISAFCARYSVGYKWQALKFGGKHALIATSDRNQQEMIWKAAHRIKGVCIKEWVCAAGGVWEGYVILQDADDAKRIDELQKEEKERVHNWCKVYDECLADGMSYHDASKYAESLYPTLV